MLRGVVGFGTGTHAAIRGYDIAGKTGTASDFKDAWFCGFTGGVVTVVWVGKDNNEPMRGITGGSAPAALWRQYMAGALPRLGAGAIPLGPAPVGPPPASPEAAPFGSPSAVAPGPAPATVVAPVTAGTPVPNPPTPPRTPGDDPVGALLSSTPPARPAARPAPSAKPPAASAPAQPLSVHLSADLARRPLIASGEAAKTRRLDLLQGAETAARGTQARRMEAAAPQNE